MSIEHASGATPARSRVSSESCTSKPAQQAPLLDSATKLQLWQVAAYGGASEVTLVGATPTPHFREKTDFVDSERSKAVAHQRARTKVRRYCVHNKIFRMFTLTYAGEGEDSLREVRRDVHQFIESLRSRLPKQFAYVWVPELHKTGHGWHVHIGFDQFVPQNLLSDVWGHGFVSANDLRKKAGGNGSARRAAGYLSKYIGKTFESGAIPKGSHRYEVAQGFEPTCARERVQALPQTAINHCISTYGHGEIPSYIWRSSELPDWTGPPVIMLQWA